ncbi:hypothetical protein QQX98_003239 [Neonectria punicea]|uniref:Transcription factor domain-containing protein n=1 Tax=Neonectria punicea TaxID=979145 RepID=A0ABR1HEM6_9HYPO
MVRYGDVFDNARRDETVKLERYHSHRSKAVLRATTPIRYFAAMLYHPELPRTISPNAEDDALGFFFLRYSLSHDLNTTCSFFGILPDMYAKSSVSSPLNHATRALALRVTDLHRTHGGKPSVGGELYAKAVSQVKNALTVPVQCRSDELLMATLVLEAYDDASTTFGKREDGASRSSTHLRGSIALLQYRGALNYGDELSWRLVTATRNRLLHDSQHSADRAVGIEAVQNIWDCGGAHKPQGPAVEADTLAFRLSWLRHRATITGSPIEVDYTEQLSDIVSQASHLANDCAVLQSSLPLSWQPASIPASSLAKSIQALSVYEHVTPTVYSQLSVAHATNRQRLTELGCMSLIASCLANIAMRDELHCKPPRRLLPSPLLARAQILIDNTCASVPFLTGDATADTASARPVLVPSVVQTSSEGISGNRTLPEDTTKHTQQVVASGLYMMYITLTAVLDLAGGDKMMDLLRPGQEKWIVGQIDRLRAILPLANVPI